MEIETLALSCLRQLCPMAAMKLWCQEATEPSISFQEATVRVCHFGAVCRCGTAETEEQTAEDSALCQSTKAVEDDATQSPPQSEPRSK